MPAVNTASARHRVLHRALLVLAIALSSAEAGADTRVAEQVLARVDGKPVLLSEIRARAKARLRDLGGRPAETQKIYAEALEARIDEEIVKTIAIALHLTIDGAEVNQTISAIATSQGTTAEGILAEALAHGWSPRDYREVIRLAVLRQRVIYTLGLRDKTAGPYPASAEARNAWLAQVENGAFAQEKKKACVERFVRW